jgi:hypothetical protein
VRVAVAVRVTGAVPAAGAMQVAAARFPGGSLRRYGRHDLNLSPRVQHRVPWLIPARCNLESRAQQRECLIDVVRKVPPLHVDVANLRTPTELTTGSLVLLPKTKNENLVGGCRLRVHRATLVLLGHCHGLNSMVVITFQLCL